MVQQGAAVSKRHGGFLFYGMEKDMTLLAEFLKSNEEKPVRVAVAGDAMVDEYYYANVKRLSPEFPIPVVQTPHQQPNYALPGGAANVAYQMRYFNAQARLMALIDSYSLAVFEQAGLNLHSCVEMVYGYGHIPRKRRFYSKDFPMFRWDIEMPRYGIDNDHLNGYLNVLFGQPIQGMYDAIILSDYDKGLFGGIPRFKSFLQHGIPTIIDPKGNDIAKWAGCTIFKPNSVEAAALSGETSWELQCNYFRQKLNCQAVVITQEGDGVVGMVDSEYFEYRPKSKAERAESVIGAGDCFIAFLAMAVGRGFTVQQAAEIAFEAGSLYVRRKHNEPITPRQLRLKDDPIAAKVVTLNELLETPRKPTQKWVFTNGCFDLLHPGHISTLKFAKSKGDRLIVGVNTDRSVSSLKPGRPYMPLHDRMNALASLEMVDYVVSFDEKTPLVMIEQLEPDVLVKGAEYKVEDIVGNEIVKEVYVAPMVEGFSTTALAQKIREG